MIQTGNIPLVSVIIPNYNHSRYLDERITSVLNQSYKNIEVIILDDCSTDGSKQIIERYLQSPRISHVLYNEQNGGSTFKQWEKGLNLVKGEFIWIAESDDSADSRFLEKMVPSLENADIVLVFCQSYRYSDGGEIKGTWKNHSDLLPDSALMDNDFVHDGPLFVRNFMIYQNIIPNASAVLFKAEAYRKVGGVNVRMKINGDWEL